MKELIENSIGFHIPSDIVESSELLDYVEVYNETHNHLAIGK
jgi:hypothetical protein